jgi:hypothetical protein
MCSPVLLGLWNVREMSSKHNWNEGEWLTRSVVTSLQRSHDKWRHVTSRHVIELLSPTSCQLSMLLLLLCVNVARRCLWWLVLSSFNNYTVSVSIITSYKRNDKSSIPGRGFSLGWHAHTGCGAHIASYPLGTSSFFSGVRRPEREVDNSLPCAEIETEFFCFRALTRPRNLFPWKDACVVVTKLCTAARNGTSRQNSQDHKPHFRCREISERRWTRHKATLNTSCQSVIIGHPCKEGYLPVLNLGVQWKILLCRLIVHLVLVGRSVKGLRSRRWKLSLVLWSPNWGLLKRQLEQCLHWCRFAAWSCLCCRIMYDGFAHCSSGVILECNFTEHQTLLTEVL